jgi:hypothetical protein
MLDRDCAISGAEIFVPPLLPLSNEQITPRGGSLSEDAGSSGHIRNPARAPPRDQSEVRFPATPPRLRTPILKRVNSANSTYRVFSAHNGRSRKFTYDGSCDELKMSIYEYIAPTIFHLQATMEKRDASDFTSEWEENSIVHTTADVHQSCILEAFTFLPSFPMDRN